MEEVQRFYEEHHEGIERARRARKYFYGYLTRVLQTRIPSGQSVLDIGCNGGFYSIEMKRRGAERVLGIDFDAGYLAQARFAAEVAELNCGNRKLRRHKRAVCALATGSAASESISARQSVTG